MRAKQNDSEADITINETRDLRFDFDGFHGVVDVATDPVICINEQGLISYWNLGAELLFGYPASEAIDKPVTMLMPENYRRRFGSAFDSYLTGKQRAMPIMGKQVLPAIRKDGSKIFVELSRSQWEREGKIFFTGILRDVTDRQRWEKDLSRRVAHEQAIASIASRLVGVTILDQAIDEALADIGEICGADHTYLYLFDEDVGTSSKISPNNLPSELDSLKSAEVLHFPDLSKLPAKTRSGLKKIGCAGANSLLFLPISINGEVAGFIRIDNARKRRHWEADDLALLEVSSSIIGSALERALNEEKLRKSEERHRRLFENAPISLWQVDYAGIMEHFESLRGSGVTDFRSYFADHPEAVAEWIAMLSVDYVNKATLDLFRADSKRALVKTMGFVFSDTSFAGFKEQFIKFTEGQVSFAGENIATALDGSVIHFNIEIFGLPERKGPISKAYWAITDISKRKKAEQATKRRIEYEKLISGLATRFVAPTDFDQTIHLTLKELGGFSNADYSFLCFFKDDGRSLEKAYSWRDENSSFLINTDPTWRLDYFPWIIDKLKSREAVRLNDIAKSATLKPGDRKQLLKEGFKSMLIIPLFQEARLIGCIGFACRSRPKDWGEENISLLLVASSIIGNALERQASDVALRASEQKYRTLIESAGDAIFVADIETGIIIDVNKEAERLVGQPANDIIGLHQSQLHPAEETAEYKRMFSERIKQGVASTTDVFVVNKDGKKIPVEISASLVDIGGKQIVQGIFRNATDRLQARDLHDALSKIISEMNSTLQFDYIIRRVIIEASKALGVESAIAFIADGEDFAVRDFHNHPKDLAGAKFKKNELSYFMRTARRRQPVVINDTLNDPRANQRTAEKLGTKSSLAIPLVIREEVVGCLTFHQNTRAVAFNEAQIDFAGQLGTAVSFALENARLYAEKRHIADALQHSLLTMPKEIRGVRFGNLYRSATRTARVGGDFYDIFDLQDGRIGMVIGDVSGKGLEAAKLTSLVKNTIRAYAADGHSAAGVMKKTNELTLQVSQPSTFVTVFLGILDIETGQLSYCSGGHPPALIKKGVETAKFLATNSPAVGIMPNFRYKTDRYALQRGEVIFLYTDGATDARRDGELFGEVRLQQLVSRLKPGTTEEIPHLVFAELLDFSHAELVDDLALLAISLV